MILKFANKVCWVLVLIVSSHPLEAYIGPGMGGGVILGVLGFLLAIFLAIVGVLYYPVKMMIRKRRSARKSKKGENPKDRQ